MSDSEAKNVGGRPTDYTNLSPEQVKAIADELFAACEKLIDEQLVLSKKLAPSLFGEG